MKNHMVTSTDAEKYLTNSTLFIFKKKKTIECIPQLDKGHLQNSIDNIIVDSERLNPFLQRLGKRQDALTCAFERAYRLQENK